MRARQARWRHCKLDSAIIPASSLKIAFPSQEAAVQSWTDFQADPEWKAVKEVSEKDGKLAEKIESVYLRPTNYSPLK